MSPSPSSTSVVSTWELVVVVSANTADLARFLFLFFDSTTWVAAWEVDIFHAVFRVHRGAATLDGAIQDVVVASLSLPTVELETYSSTGGTDAACTFATSRTL
jgi:hypothetical protein